MASKLAAINAELNALDWDPPLRRLPSLDAASRTVRPNAKPEPRKRTKGRKDRAETKQKHMVRMLCVARDGGCRICSPNQFTFIDRGVDPLVGDLDLFHSEWAHMHARRRSQTRNMAPEIRHDSAHSLMLCTKHHADYDAHRLRITALTRKGADGPLKFARMK